jgi:hypothetical protein
MCVSRVYLRTLGPPRGAIHSSSQLASPCPATQRAAVCGLGGAKAGPRLKYALPGWEEAESRRAAGIAAEAWGDGHGSGGGGGGAWVAPAGTGALWGATAGTRGASEAMH